MDLPLFFGDLAMRSSLLLGVAWAGARLMGRASAAERHLAWVLALTVLLFLPAEILFGPKIAWPVPIPRSLERPHMAEIPAVVPTVEASSADDVISVANAEPVSTFTLSLLTLSNGLAAIWGGGALLQVAILAAATRTWRDARRSGSPAGLPTEVLDRARAFACDRALPPILLSDAIDVPVLVGWMRPVILLPQAALTAPTDRLVMMICHELAHLRRADARLLSLLALVRVVYWWQPLAWVALARLRREREAACDDLVLGGPFRASDYAELIVDAARKLQATRPLPVGAFAMAMNSPVHERLGAILDSSLRRRPPSRGMLFLSIFVAAFAGFALAGTEIEASSADTAAPSKPVPGQPPRQILIEFKLMSVDEKVYQANKARIDDLTQGDDAVSLASLIQFANGTPGIELLSAPTVTTLDGQKAEVDIVREFPYPAAGFKDEEQTTAFTPQMPGKLPIPPEFKEEDIGLKVEATPHLTADQRAVDLGLDCKIVTFEGWNRSQPGIRQPIFVYNNIKTNWLLGSNNSYGHVFSELARGDLSPNVDAAGVPNPPAPDAPLKRSILIAIARILPPERTVSIPGNVLIRTALRFFQISEKTYATQPEAIDAAMQSGKIGFLERLPDYKLLETRDIYTSPDQVGILEESRVIEMPNTFTKDAAGQYVPLSGSIRRLVGFRVPVKAQITTSNDIDVSLFPEITQFSGLVPVDDRIKPVFNVGRFNLKVLLVPGNPAGFWMRTEGPSEENILFRDQPNGRVDWKKAVASASDKGPLVRVGFFVDASLWAADGAKIGKWIAP
jgi:beta-lactamase regulating signal transducer with metallopeptidase domain